MMAAVYAKDFLKKLTSKIAIGQTIAEKIIAQENFTIRESRKRLREAKKKQLEKIFEKEKAETESKI